MDTVQIYEIVNGVAGQVLGNTAIQVVDTNSFVSLGNAVLSSNTNVENFTNILVERIAKTIISFRMYESILKPIVFDDIRWGAIVQKIKAEMPQAIEDEAYDLVDGDSIDMYVVKKPKFKQKFFVNRTPYSFMVTIQRWQLRRAFTGEYEMGAFISAIFGEIQNALEMTFENLGYLTMANYMANAIDSQVINLVSNYNTASGNSVATGKTALLDNDFLRYAIGQMNLASRRLATMSTLYNAEGATRHTPIRYQRYIAIADFIEALKTVVQWEAFHENYVSKATTIEVPHWQNAQSPMSIMVTNEDGTTTTLNNIIGFIHDRDALGTYRKEQEVLTTPVNARGRYTNTFWHEEQMWFNDMSENGLIFTLN